MKYTSILSVLLAIQIKAAGVPEYGQCGGLTWTGPKVCAPGLTCVPNNLYYSHCYYVTSTLTPSSTSSVRSSTSTSTSFQPEWSQCGGTGWAGPTFCAPGLTCHEEASWFYQCLNLTTSSTSTIITGTSTSTFKSTSLPTSSSISSTSILASSSTSAFAGVPQYAQCGGQGYTGPTVCAPGLTCLKASVFFSTCHNVTITSSTTIVV